MAGWPHLRRCPGHPLRQQGSEALAQGNLLDQLQHGRCVAEAQVQAPGFLRSQEAILETLHSEGDNAATGYTIEAVGGSKLIGFGNGL